MLGPWDDETVEQDRLVPLDDGLGRLEIVIVALGRVEKAHGSPVVIVE